MEKDRVSKVEILREKFFEKKPKLTKDSELRIYRSLSWLTPALDETLALDMRFISLWISFNAAYAQDLDKDIGKYLDEHEVFQTFINKVCRYDHKGELYNLLWQKFPQSIRIMLECKYTFQPFWDYQNQLISEEIWETRFIRSRKKALEALKIKDSSTVLIQLFSHLYTLRNQIVHGGATFKSSLNRPQVADACRILESFMPIMIDIMLDSSDEVDWGKTFYPVVHI